MMRNTKKAVVLMALLAGAFAAPSLKNKLGQMNAKNLAELGGGLGQGEGGEIFAGCDISALAANFSLPQLPNVECPCVFTPIPGLGAAQSQGLQQRVEASQVQTLQQVPDTSFSQICRSNCCECAEAAHAAIAQKAKNRTFTINGAISVIERVQWCEEQLAAEYSTSEAEKDTICVLNNKNGGLGNESECITVTICPPGLGTQGGLQAKTPKPQG